MSCKVGLTKVGEESWCRGPDDIDHGVHVCAGALSVGLPIRYRFVQIQNRFVQAETYLIKQGSVESKLFPDEDLVIPSHCNDKVGSVDQLLGELPLDMTGQIGSLLAQSGLDPFVHRLGLDVDPGRADNTGCADTESGLERILGCHTPEDIPRTHEQD